MNCATVQTDRIFDRPTAQRPRMRTVALGLIAALSVISSFSSFSSWGHLPGALAGNERPPTADEVRALAAEAWRYPPPVFDITAITTTNQILSTEDDVRSSIERLIAQQKIDDPQCDTSPERIEAEVKRNMDLERVPDVRKERWRNRGLDFCVDSATMHDAASVIDADTPFEECLFFLQDGLDAPVVSGRKAYESKTLSIYAPENAWNIERGNLCEGGAFCFRGVLLLKTLFGWPAITESDPGLEESTIKIITSGLPGNVTLRVVEEGSKKTFIARSWMASAAFTCQGDTILPVMEEVVSNAAGQLVSRMKVTELNAAGEAVEFEMLGPPKRPNEPAMPVKVRVLARQIGGELPADTFSLERPEGWSKWDGRTRELIYFDGTPREAPPRRAEPKVATPDTVKRTLFQVNVAIVVALASYYLWYFLCRKPAAAARPAGGAKILGTSK